jgi:hypothetical protein
MSFLLTALAVGLAAIGWARPRKAPGAGVLSLFAAGIVVPWAERFRQHVSGSQMYCWAVGVLITTLAAAMRLGLRRVFSVLRSAEVFLGVALAWAVHAEAQGAATSCVLRHFYGILLLIAYLGVALHAGG